MSRGLLADREVIPQALQLNPRFFQVVYTEMLNSKKTRKNVEAALDAIDSYLSGRMDLFDPILEHLREVGEARSASDIEHHFERNFGIEGVTTACEFLADRGLIGKASIATKLTKRSESVEVQELALRLFLKLQFATIGEAHCGVCLNRLANAFPPNCRNFIRFQGGTDAQTIWNLLTRLRGRRAGQSRVGADTSGKDARLDRCLDHIPGTGRTNAGSRRGRRARGATRIASASRSQSKGPGVSALVAGTGDTRGAIVSAQACRDR
jgi:hypothetical protein